MSIQKCLVWLSVVAGSVFFVAGPRIARGAVPKLPNHQGERRDPLTVDPVADEAQDMAPRLHNAVFGDFALRDGTHTVPDGASGSPLKLVSDSKTTYAIYHEASAPLSVTMAASELQHYFKEATGAELPIVHEPREPVICLGENDFSRAAGLPVRDVPPEGFRITTRGENVYILGPDTPEGQRTPGGGSSTGTRNGTYAFLERFLGVRWLMPGDSGDYVPKAADIAMPETDITDAPFFLNRRVPYTQQGRPEVKKWWARQRLGWSLYLHHSHNWRRPIPPDLFDEHPEWFAERSGERVRPTGRYKLCTTNQELVRAFAEAAIGHFDAYPQTSCFSLSPSDSMGWCECSECSALYETDPNGNRSVTPAILKFYNDVARLVGEKHPDKLLAGYVYSAYVFPPRQRAKLEPNVFLVWAPSFDYGFRLFRPELRRQWEHLATEWTRITDNIAYYDLPNCIHNEVGAPNPPGLKILRFLYPRLKRAAMKGVYVYGNPAWGHSALMNYLLAKLAWNPQADVEALFDEFCDKAYERGTEEMKEFYRLLERETERYFLANADERWVLSAGRMRDVYARNFATLERLYRTAKSRIVDSDANARLEMLGANLKVLHWNLCQLNLLEGAQTSSFYLTDDDFFSFVTENRRSLAMTPFFETRKPSVVRSRLELCAAEPIQNAEAVRDFRLRGDQHILLRPAGTRTPTVRFSDVEGRGTLATYAVYDDRGNEIGAGVLSEKKPVVLEELASKYYHLVISAGRSASFQLRVSGASWAVNGRFADKGLHLLGRVTPVYFQVPAAIESFHLQLEATPPGETATATLYSPNGRKAARFDCSAKPVDRKKVTVVPGETGFWKLTIERAKVGALDDVWILPGDGLSGYFSLVPDQALRLRTNYIGSGSLR